MELWVNFILFQSVYMLSMLGVTYDHAWLGPAGLVVFAAWHAFTTRVPKADFLLAGIAMLMGFCLDTLYMRSGLISYHGELFWTGAAPLWIIALWANFALTLSGSLRWLRSRLVLATILASTFGPLSYYAGIRFGAATITGDPVVLFGLIAVTWGVAVPLLLWLSSQLEQQLQPRNVAALPAG